MAAATGSKRRKARVFVVDDHPIVRRGLEEVLQGEPDLAVCGTAETVEEALRGIGDRSPDLVIVDLTLEGAGGLDLLKDLKLRHPGLPVLVFSMHDEALFAERALRAGAMGYVMKQESVGELQAAIRRLLSGRIHLSPAMSERLLRVVARGGKPRDGSPLERLSDRELEVFEMIGRGLATREIAGRLHLSVKTVETHRAHIKEKLHLDSSVRVVQQAAQWVQGKTPSP